MALGSWEAIRESVPPCVEYGACEFQCSFSSCVTYLRETCMVIPKEKTHIPGAFI
jgi:hypothetical protein